MDPLHPRFGIQFIGYPALGLVFLSLPVGLYSRTSAIALLLMSLGYLCTGVGFALTLVLTKRVRQS